MRATSSRPPTRRARARARHRAIAVPRSRRLASWWGGPVVARLEGLLFDQRHGEARTGRVGARVPARARNPTPRADPLGSSRHLAARTPTNRHETGGIRHSPLTVRQPPIPHQQRDCGHFGLNPRPPCHGEGRGFESHHPLYKAPGNGGFFDARACGVVLLERNGPTVRRGRFVQVQRVAQGFGRGDESGIPAARQSRSRTCSDDCRRSERSVYSRFGWYRDTRIRGPRRRDRAREGPRRRSRGVPCARRIGVRRPSRKPRRRLWSTTEGTGSRVL